MLSVAAASHSSSSSSSSLPLEAQRHEIIEEAAQIDRLAAAAARL
jgi:hypothetical protein